MQLCFKAPLFQSTNRRLIPYKVEKDTMWGNEPYTAGVTEYSKERARNFRLAEEGRLAALETWRQKTYEQWKMAAIAAVVGWVVLSLLQAIIGGIVRGFLGIPRGRDVRPEPVWEEAQVS